MRISDLEVCLNSYDSYKGSLLRPWIDESHIRVFRALYTELKSEKDRELTGAELVRVAEIILSKTTWEVSEACITLSMLANRMGGKKALDRLKQNNQINADNLVVLDYYHQMERKRVLPQQITREAIEAHGDLIADYILSLSAALPAAEIIPSGFFDKTDRQILINRREDIASLAAGKIERREAYFATLVAEDSQEMVQILLLLKRHGLCKENNIALLPATAQQLQLLRKILVIFDATQDQVLMLQSNVSALLGNANLLARFSEVISELDAAKKLTQSSLTSLFTQVARLEEGKAIAGLLAHFRESGWDLENNLTVIFASGSRGTAILDACIRVKKLEFPPNRVQQLLNNFFAQPAFSKDVAEAFETLAGEGIEDNEYSAILRAPRYAKKLAKAIVIQRSFSGINEGARDCITSFMDRYPDHADDLALAFNQLVLAGFNTIETRELLLSQPENAAQAALILEQMSQHNLFKRGNPKSLANLKLLYTNYFVCTEFVTLTRSLVAAGLFEQETFDRFAVHTEFFTPLFEACSLLGDKLDQTNLNLLFDDPSQALQIAKILNEGTEAEPPVEKRSSLKGSKDTFFQSHQATPGSIIVDMPTEDDEDKENTQKPLVKRVWYAIQATIDNLTNEDSSDDEPEEYNERGNSLTVV
ncbi:hypothetical protein BN59_03035 [Legionella massiliensis]|uniref:Uncharacterized protein n=1 Tax=Legionella massiliensis TaxID=1034943 RepID=A0A078L451_9GAMM|nr:hypothetical protein [Legionella massiliensis]CDZ78723.1 hypothetical protein BN59_03035 [Legionella massiliensis]CEE14461.1 hypothetical protein BN1094_03035 [Legionella massiliensis]